MMLMMVTRLPARAALTATVLVLGACATQEAPGPGPEVAPVPMAPAQPPGRSSNWLCGTQAVTLEYRGDAPELRVGRQRYALEPVPSASGARYQGVRDSETGFWNQGDRSLLTVQGQEFPECVPVNGTVPALRARGNEPGWALVILGGNLNLNLDYGTTNLSAPAPAPRQVGDATVYEAMASGQAIVVQVRNQACMDSMSGVGFPQTVTLQVGDRQLQGCGGDALDSRRP